MSDAERWVGRVYGARSNRELEAAYDGWAGDYDRHLLSLGYGNLGLATGLVERYVERDDGAILDAGCGTGQLGLLLGVLGRENLVGIDLSEGMLEVARGHGVYRELHRMVLGESLAFADHQFAACVSLGVMTAGHAPPATLHELCRVTRPGGHLIFTLTDPALEQWGFAQKLDEMDASGCWERIERTAPYHPMPFSETEGDLVSYVFVYRVR
jgi:SAM-dependent methyltransferase